MQRSFVHNRDEVDRHRPALNGLLLKVDPGGHPVLDQVIRRTCPFMQRPRVIGNLKQPRDEARVPCPDRMGERLGAEEVLKPIETTGDNEPVTKVIRHKLRIARNDEGKTDK